MQNKKDSKKNKIQSRTTGDRLDIDLNQDELESGLPSSSMVKEQSTKKQISNEETSAHTKATLSNVDKVYFPKLNITKGDVLAYYDKIGDIILPYLKDRPESLNRHPNGVDKPNFFQKNLSTDPPSFVDTYTRTAESTGKKVTYAVCNNKDTLLYLANLGCIELNPWNSRTKKTEYPDWMVIDLDPGDNTYDELVRVALEVKKVLDISCEKNYVKTSGKTGLHIYIPLGAKYTYDQIRDFSHLLMKIVHAALPDITSLERSPAKRKDKIYLDYLQNSLGQTIAAPYSLRPTEDATVSTPLQWSEVKKGFDPRKYNIKTIGKRLEKYGDLFAPVLTESVDLKAAIKCLEDHLGKIDAQATKTVIAKKKATKAVTKMKPLKKSSKKTLNKKK